MEGNIKADETETASNGKIFAKGANILSENCSSLVRQRAKHNRVPILRLLS